MVRADGAMEVHGWPTARWRAARSCRATRRSIRCSCRPASTAVARGQPPLATLDDLARAMAVVDAAYAANRAGGTPVASNVSGDSE